VWKRYRPLLRKRNSGEGKRETPLVQPQTGGKFSGRKKMGPPISYFENERTGGGKKTSYMDEKRDPIKGKIEEQKHGEEAGIGMEEGGKVRRGLEGEEVGRKK